MSITQRLLLNSCVAKRHREEPLEDFLGRITHLQLQEHKLESLVSQNFALCRSLEVLYIYGNKLTSLEGLRTQHRIREIYAQDNCIESMLGAFDHVPLLTRLYLGGNSIRQIDGLGMAGHLMELDVSKQRIGEPLIIYPEAFDAARDSLRSLNISGCNIVTLSFLVGLDSLEFLDASNNSLSDCDFEETVEVLGSLPNLRVVILKGNPICKVSRYWEKIIAKSNIEVLDGKETTPVMRERIRQVMSHQSRVRAGAGRRQPSSSQSQSANNGPDIQFMNIQARGSGISRQ